MELHAPDGKLFVLHAHDLAFVCLCGDLQTVSILNGSGGEIIRLTFMDGRKSYDVQKVFNGVIGNLDRRLLQTESNWMREELSKYQSSAHCEVCSGARLKPEARARGQDCGRGYQCLDGAERGRCAGVVLDPE